jgi:hypothetical protein
MLKVNFSYFNAQAEDLVGAITAAHCAMEAHGVKRVKARSKLDPEGYSRLYFDYEPVDTGKDAGVE